MKRAATTAVIAVVFWPLVIIQIASAQNYRATLLDHPDGPFTAYDINDAGQIAGTVEIAPNTSLAVRREPDGQFTDLPGLGGNLSRPFGINDLGHLCGFANDETGGSHAVVWENGAIRELAMPAGGAFPTAFDINNQGIVIGSFTDADNFFHAVVWDAEGNVQPLPELDGFVSVASAINDAGEIAGAITIPGGARAVLWQPNPGGSYDALDLGTLGGPRAGARGLNNNGQVAGFSFLDDSTGVSHAFVWENGQMTDLGTLGGNNSLASAINDQGDVVGFAKIGPSTSAQISAPGQAYWSTLLNEAQLANPLVHTRRFNVLQRQAEQDRAVRWKLDAAGNPIADLNELSDSTILLNDAFKINSQFLRGSILGKSIDSTTSTTTHYLLSPSGQALPSALSRPVVPVVDTNALPDVFEADLIADEQDVLIDGTVVHTIIYKDANSPDHYLGTPNGFPVPQMEVNVGDEVIVTLTNNIEPSCAAIACDTSIHWHGVEADNDSDGTGVTQNRVALGESYTYRFRAPRPGVFWFHPHMKPGPQTFAGTYGTFIVKDPNEEALQTAGTIPPAANTHTLVLSDIEFDADGDVGYLDAAGNAIPWATLHMQCAAGTQASCQRMIDGATVLVNGNGVTPDSGVPTITAKSGSGIRLRLLNVATHRYFRLSVQNNGADNNLYRIGGEGGFLDFARLEGGILGTWDTKINKGEIVLSTAEREDVVIVPSGTDGDEITITGTAFSRGAVTSNATGDLLKIVIDNTLEDTPFTIAEGIPILGAGGVEDIKGVTISDFFIPPVPTGNPGDGNGSTDQRIRLNAVAPSMPAIDSIVGHLEDSGPDYTLVPYGNATRYAATGSVIEFTISNGTNQHHPFHLHGFSVQPVRVLNHGADINNPADDTVLYNFDYAEFVDVINLFPGESIVLRSELEDRPRITDNRQETAAPTPGQKLASGGAAGRWVFHSHLFRHAAVGMISELVVVDTDRDGDGFDTSVDCDDHDPAVNPAATEIPGDGIDNDCNGIFDDLPPEIINDKMSLDANQMTVLDPTPTPDGPAGTYTLTWTFTNISVMPFGAPFFAVTDLSGGNVVINADGGPAGVGAMVTPNVGPDQILSPGESITVDFVIGLQTLPPFTFFVDVIGAPIP